MSPEKPKPGADTPQESEPLDGDDLAALEHLLSETEAALERAAALVGEADEAAEAEPGPAAEPAAEPVAEASAVPPVAPAPPRDPLADAEAVLEEARRVRGAEAEPPPIPAATPSDPFGAAEEALRRARAARGVKEPSSAPADEAVAPDYSHLVRDPFADAEAALEAAKQMRERARVGQEGLLREAKARAELKRLKELLRGKKGPSEEPEPHEDPGDAPPKEKKRRL
jgi:hypothetical protein